MRESALVFDVIQGKTTVDVALPYATRNELNADDAETLLAQGVI